MMILLASFTNHEKNDVPLTFILIVILYLGREILNAFKGDDISQFAHLAGGLCGSLFGFFKPVRSTGIRKKATARTSKTTSKVMTGAQLQEASSQNAKVTIRPAGKQKKSGNDTPGGKSRSAKIDPDKTIVQRTRGKSGKKTPIEE